MEELLTRIFKLGKVKDEYIRALLENIDVYKTYAFTSSKKNHVHNYQLYEFLGDSVINTFIPFYFFRRFPQLSCTTGVKVLNRLKANHVSKKSLSKIARSHGFLDLINRSSNENSAEDEESLLEDVFEAFFGVTVILLDNMYVRGVGHAISYDILKGIFDRIDVSLEFNVVYDAKSRLKELMEQYPAMFPGKMSQMFRAPDNIYEGGVCYVYLNYKKNGRDLTIKAPVEIADHPTKSEREQAGAQFILDKLKEVEGIDNSKKEIELFCNSLVRPI